ncbi:MAG: UbiA prenyltransferase family protein [Ilumatobacteraceae bacterium]
MTATTSEAPVSRWQAIRALSGKPTLEGHIGILRPDHWFKQVFALPGIAAALSDSTGTIPGGIGVRIVAGFASLCLVASSNYVINEMLDAPSDLSHPTKRLRPVPSGKVNITLGYVEWIATMVVGVGIGFLINVPFGLTVLALWGMGCIYNIPPVRSKDLPYLDVLSESINNPLRMLAGWYMTGINAFAPTSLLLSYWFVGCYFMALKRYAEYNEIGDPKRAAQYRESFAYYTPERLLVSVVFYASAAMLFLGAFVMRYRLELILAFPLIAIVMAIYFSLAFQPESGVINPERLYKQPRLMLAVTVCALAMLALLFIDIPALDTVFRPTGLNIRT